MAITSAQQYSNALTALGICIRARIPALLWGNPGEGKTAVIESARDLGIHVETVIITHSEPSDFAGLPVVQSDGSVNLAPPGWAKRLHDHEGPAIAFFDEFSTASPSLQAAALRPLTHYEVGSIQLPNTVSFVAAANPADVATAGWELAAPTASRFVHLDWGLPLDVYSEALVTGAWPTLPIPELPPDYADWHGAEAARVAGFLRARASQFSSIPVSAAERGRAFPTPRTWDYAARLAALAKATGANSSVVRLLVAGCVGDSAAHEYLVWVSAQELPDPEALLADPEAAGLWTLRSDRIYVALQSVVAAVVRNNTPERWTAAVDLCGAAAEHGFLDPAVPVVRALLRLDVRPAGAGIPSSIRAFGGALALAGLLPKR